MTLYEAKQVEDLTTKYYLLMSIKFFIKSNVYINLSLFALLVDLVVKIITKEFSNNKKVILYSLTEL